jgi:subtilisin-like proprotein convertase family protein
LTLPTRNRYLPAVAMARVAVFEPFGPARAVRVARAASLAAALMAVLPLAACGGGTGPTTIQLRVRYDAAWGLTGLVVSADGQVGQGPVGGAVDVLVPDAWAGAPHVLEVAGVRGGDRVAAARIAVTPVLGARVSADVGLSLLPCGAWCTTSATECQGDGVAVCEVRDTCRGWSAPVPCGGDTPFCSLGVCGQSCIDECAAGERRCAGPQGFQICGQADGDTCRDWQAVVVCPAGESCSNGQCAPACASECPTAGVTACLGGAMVTCGDLNVDGCLEWSPPSPCGAGASCSNGACSSSCSDDCSASMCVGTTFLACGQFDLDACTDLSPGTSCVPADPCMVGECTATGCTSKPKVCDQPPGPECIGGNLLRTYDAVGTCTAGACFYPPHEVPCPNCPSCDPCAGVTCTKPPPATCVSPTTRRTFAASGTCSGGTCNYAPTDTVCPGGCAGATCQPPEDEEQSCGDGLDNDGDGATDCADTACAAACDVLTCAPPAKLVVVTNDETLSIPDPGSVVSMITPVAPGTVQSLVVRMTISHGYTGDIVASVAAGGKTVLLVEMEGLFGDDFVDTFFYDGATKSIVGAMAPFTGAFRPQALLSGLVPRPFATTWMLTVTDNYSGVAGTLRSWSIVACVAP